MPLTPKETPKELSAATPDLAAEVTPPPASLPAAAAPSLRPHVSDPSLTEPLRYIQSVPGKNVRALLIDSFQQWFCILSPETVESIKEIVGILHDASLLVDDIEDGSLLRRGVPVAHSIFGVPSVINCANYAYFMALERCHALRNRRALDVFVSEMLNLHRGQGQDILWRDSGRCPTEDEYCDMVVDKTGGLFRLAVGIMQAFASEKAGEDFVPLVNKLGLYFQIRDDLVNLSSEEYMKEKSFCEDLTEGKFSFPIIHCILSDSTNTRLSSILKRRTEDLDVKRYAQTIIREAGSLAYARDKCKDLREDILSMIAGFGGNDLLEGLIKKLDRQLEGLDIGEGGAPDEDARINMT